MGSEVTKPIPNGLHDGKVIQIRGSVPAFADVFEVNFLTDMEPSYSDRPLHLSIRFKDRVVVRNTWQLGKWENEERQGAFPFNILEAFNIKIIVQMNCYKILVNNQHCWDFVHRIPFQRANTIFIKGDVEIKNIEFTDRGGFPSTPCQPSYPFPNVSTNIHPPPQQYNLPPVYNPTVPYAYPLYGGPKPGMMIYISGSPSFCPYRFTINLQTGTSPYTPPDIALHFDVRFYDMSIVRNTRTNNQWHHEEREKPNFPFQPNVHFDMIIRVTKNQFMVAVNGQHFIEFRHRLRPLSRFDTLFIEHDVAIQSIRIA